MSGKAPGPDGYPAEFYKKFYAKLTPLLCKVFEEVLATRSLPLTMTQTTMSVLLKKNRDPLNCDSYCPISLLCCEYEIMTKVLAARIEPIMNKIIHPDQTGFVAGRQLPSNLCCLLNVLYLPSDYVNPGILISMDAHKAFDRTEYPYLFTALKRFSFGPKFCSWIEILYTMSQASIQTR